MQAELTHVLQLSLQNPRAAARHLLDRQLPISAILLALALMAVASAMLTGASVMLAPEQVEPNFLTMLKNPLQVAVLQGLVMVVMAMLAQGVGRLFGGNGTFAEALVLITWTEALLCLLQLVQIVLVLLSPSLAAALGMFGIVLSLWVLSNFVAEMHRFASAGKVLLGIILTVLAVAFVMAVAMAVLIGAKG